MSDFSLRDLILEAKAIKKAFVPPMSKDAGAMPPMDPSMMGGAAPAPAGMPMGPAADGSLPPMDPSMMGGEGAMPPAAPAMEGAQPQPQPPEAPDSSADIQELMQVVSQMAEGMDKIESKQDALEQKYQDTISQFDEMRGKIDMLINILEGKKSGI